MMHPSPLMVLPFGLLLGLMALAPLSFPDWWGKHYPKVCLGLGVWVIVYYLVGLQATGRVLETTQDYFRFIILISSLFIVSGGIHISVRGEATPLANVVFLLIGALVANLVGTTGASMLLIRPWLRMNKFRVTAHHVVFFIFLVSNVGGCLTPVGDPPLYLGYLKGVPFWWVTQHCWPIWCVGVGVLLTVFFVVDTRNYRRVPKAVREELAEPPDVWRFTGLPNLAFLGVILGAAFIQHPFLLRELLMCGAAAGSYTTTKQSIHESNHFSLQPLKEVAILFAGIFATMLPALDWLQGSAGQLGDPTPGFYFVGSGTLSSVLDNAPTYLTFLSAILGAFVEQDILTQIQQLIHDHGVGLTSLSGQNAELIQKTFAALGRFHPAALAKGTVQADEIGICLLLRNPSYHKLIMAVSTGAVFFGANTYIGNGPNLMVKAIADQQKIHTPSFLRYVTHFTIPYMLPMLLLVWWIFFRS
jgi:Na+/H+ antiporter NhaD/arsenite permease-like protein